MTSNSFGKRLARELTRNKAKSAALGILVLVALYFWLPLFGKYFKKKKNTPSAAPAVETTPIASASAAPKTPGAMAEEIPQFDWKEFLTWMAHEPRMTVVSTSAETRDPFSPSVSKRAVQQEQLASEKTEEPEEPKIVLGPKECGLQLRATFVGARSSSANLNGVNYRVGAWIPIPGTGETMNEDDVSTTATSTSESTETESHPTNVSIEVENGFQLLEVKPRYVTLQREGQLFRLELNERTGVERNIIIRSAQP